MISLLETTRIPAPPERVWAWLCQLDEHYPEWHPEQLRWRTLRGEPLAVGTVWFADEWVGPLRLSARFFVTASEPGRWFAYRIGFPSSLGRAGGSFRLEPTPDGACVLEEEVHFGFSTPIIGPLVDRLLALALPLGELRRHMREEGEGLVKMLG